MTKWSTMLLAGAVAACVSTSFAEEKKVPAALNFKMKAIDGKEVDLAKKYDGKVVLLVNVASKCGLTPQYGELEALHEKYANKGLAVVGVPCNQFGKQEPGTNEEIVEFCKSTYNVKFDLLSKVDVNEDTACPLYKYLTSLATKPTGAGKISWNFEKFVIGKNGQVVARFAPRTAPDAPEVIKAIEDELAKK
ncbi:MAG TPA: glutathione peroxidase [Pirellulaceae bacterium]|nr:glutathione peroxidase [Pirellulaceae bacterium]